MVKRCEGPYSGVLSSLPVLGIKKLSHDGTPDMMFMHVVLLQQPCSLIMKCSYGTCDGRKLDL